MGALGAPAQPEAPPVVGADPLENPVAVEVPVVEDRDAGAVPGDELTVEENHAHRSPPPAVCPLHSCKALLPSMLHPHVHASTTRRMHDTWMFICRRPGPAPPPGARAPERRRWRARGRQERV